MERRRRKGSVAVKERNKVVDYMVEVGGGGVRFLLLLLIGWK